MINVFTYMCTRPGYDESVRRFFLMQNLTAHTTVVRVICDDTFTLKKLTLIMNIKKHGIHSALKC